MMNRCGGGAPAANKLRGFTLAEAVIVIVVTGIIASVVAVFIQKPVQGYFDAVRRAQLTDTADLALRRIARDLRTALPNSVRVTGGTTLEYLETTGGGRYRGDKTDAGAGDPLDFTAAGTSFDVIGPVPPLAAGNYIVVANLGEGTGADAYAGDNRTTYTGGSSTISVASKLFPVESPGKRFHVVSGPVAYVCNGGTLTRYWNCAIGAAPGSGTSALLASGVTNCTITYQQANPAGTRTGVVSIWLELSRDGEQVELFHQVHVVNAP